ncbi:MAG TPA: hypothetical protein VGQ05_16200 [Streptosporangiaceae bacterium]|jgi:hypothetical protein|nr:hypothetical protein [Streptosporangiaceae bacterium]
MSRRDDRQWARPAPAAPGDAGSGSSDVVGQGDRPARGPAFAAGLAVAALVLGLAVGYGVGRNQAPSRPAAVPSARPSTAATSPPPVFGLPELGQSGQQCAEQIGRRLQLGVQVTNESATSVRLSSVRVITPIGGLKQTAQAWGTCGQLPGLPDPRATLVPAGGSAWFTVTFRVLERCPGALPVQFLLSYDRGGSTKTVRLPGFVDLGHVPYSGCPVT